MEFELLRSFVAVAECGGFHRAAERLPHTVKRPPHVFVPLRADALHSSDTPQPFDVSIGVRSACGALKSNIELWILITRTDQIAG
jgi:hypothetical protein